MANTHESNITIRLASAADKQAIDALHVAEDMTAPHDVADTFVATNACGDVCGCIKLRMADDGRVFVNPVIVAQHARGLGIGRELMYHAHDIYGDLHLVARGYAVGFYRAIGLVDMSWDEVIDELTEDCAHCDCVKACAPRPMKLVGHSHKHL